MKTITLKTNLQTYLVLILFICFGFSNLYSQDNSCITLDACPTDITVCADATSVQLTAGNAADMLQSVVGCDCC